MKLFKFSLESLRTLRKQKERVAQQHYARALAACDAAGAQLQNANRELTGAWESLVRELGGGAAAAKIQGLRAWCAALESRRNGCQVALDEACRAAEAAFREMIGAVRDREALDRFCDKLRRAHERGAQREEQKHFDELAVQMSGANGLLQLAGYES
jgi:flagellar export protein FliJ